MRDLVFSARSLVQSNLGWFHKTRTTLGEAAGNERAININREIFDEWFPGRLSTDLDPREIRTRYFDGGHIAADPFEFVNDNRTIRNQGGGKNWRMAGDAIRGDFYDVRVDDIMMMAFDKATRTLSWLVLRHGNSSSRTVPPAEANLHDEVRRLLGKPAGSMWLIPSDEAMGIIDEIQKIFVKAGDLLMAEKAIMEAWQADLASTGFRSVQDVDRRLLLALKAKRFTILTGLSGSGKTLLARAFVRWICASRDHYRVVPVGSNWTSNDHIMGYPDALDQARYVKTAALELILSAVSLPHLPHFLILDEMNLSHVERYFADFLSAIESPDEPIVFHSGSTDRDDVPPRLAGLPTNLFIIGTVNVDETTYMFSPKVLDRANVIEFRAGEDALASFLSDPVAVDLDSLDAKGALYAKGFLNSSARKIGISDLGPLLKQAARDELLLLFRILADHELEFGFRSATEMLRYLAFAKSASGAVSSEDEKAMLRHALDAQVLQKLLPRLHGSRKRLEPILLDLGTYCNLDHEWDASGQLDAAPIELGRREAQKSRAIPPPTSGSPFLPMASRKIDRMLDRVRANGFASFAEG